ncbi:MarR family transcriptional regulator [Aestuariibius sp. HNIBRBA575]|uniref:MarR family transcriptional regulator n=1 Tax=Aestuariibius sp. HNIBRBA575 TaxID=3233343 RepID=UPI0034A13C17
MSLAVITGDLVGSTQLSTSQYDAALLALKTAAHQQVGSFYSLRGDGWQFAGPKPDHALRIALTFRAFLKSQSDALDSRFAIAIGDETMMPGQDIQTSNTATFVASGRLLDSMNSQILMAHSSGEYAHAATVLADHISQQWTQKQARTILPFLTATSKPTQKQVAADFGVSRQAVGQALDAAGFAAIQSALNAIETQAK